MLTGRLLQVAACTYPCCFITFYRFSAETSVDITTADEVTKQNLMESAEKLEAPAQEDATEQPEELEKVEQPETLVEVPEESILLYDDRENSLNFHSIAHSEESGRVSVKNICK